MKKKTRNIIIVVAVLILSAAVWLLIGFRGMTIEDHYGGLQEFYHQAQSGDVITIGKFEKIGLVQKSWTEIDVVDAQGNAVDLFNWVNDGAFVKTKIILYHTDEVMSPTDLQKETLIEKLNAGTLQEGFSMLEKRR